MKTLFKFARRKFFEWAINNLRGVFIQYIIILIFQIWNWIGWASTSVIGQIWSRFSLFLDIIWYVDTGVSALAIVIHLLPRRWFKKYLPNEFDY